MKLPWPMPCARAASRERLSTFLIRRRCLPTRRSGDSPTCLSRHTPRPLQKNSGTATTTCSPKTFAAISRMSRCCLRSINNGATESVCASCYSFLDGNRSPVSAYGIAPDIYSPAAQAGRGDGRFQQPGPFQRIQVATLPRGALSPAENVSCVLVWTPHHDRRLDPFFRQE